MADTVEVIKKNTRCAIQTICMSIMRITAPASDVDVQIWKAKFEPFKHIPRDALAVLYNINDVHDNRVFYPLWLFYLYVKDVDFYCEKFLDKHINIINIEWRHLNSEQIGKVHEMVTEQLLSSMDDCSGHNKFDVTDPAHFSHHIKKHFDEIRPILSTGDNYKRIDANNLFLGTRSLIQVEYHFGMIKTHYGIHIEWGDASGALQRAYEQAKHPITLYDGLQGIRYYQTLYLTLLKMVMLRMIWVHLLLVTDRIDEPEVNTAMHETANSFGTITGLNDDAAFADTVKFLQVKSSSPEAFEAAIERISSLLTESCSLFNDCKVPKIDQKFVVEYFFDLRYLHGTTSTDIQHNHKLAVYFVELVAKQFCYVDKEFVKSVLKLSYTITEHF